MILDSEDQRELLLAILSDHTFAAPGKVLTEVARNVEALFGAIAAATIAEKENEAADDG